MLHLLVVDDEKDVREFTARFFRKRNIMVSLASSGEEALASIRERRPHLVLLDIEMQGMDGRETLRSIKEYAPEVKVVMVSGKRPDDGGILDVCRTLGASAYIHKPLQLDELERLVMQEFEQPPIAKN